MATILTIHGHLRWVLALVAILALVKFVLGWFGKGKVSALDKTLGQVLAWSMTLQLILGVINLVNFAMAGAFNPGRHIEHLTYGFIAVGLSHALPLRKEERDDTARFRGAAIMTLVALLLIVLSVFRLRGSWV
jgi:hypothetical protein